MAKTGRSNIRAIAAVATACLFIYLLLLPATRAGRAVADEKRSRNCQSQSHRFKGKCFSDRNCASVCKSERFPGGKCVGFRQRCFCTKPC